MDAATPETSQQTPTPPSSPLSLTRVFLLGWRDLLRSRDTILHQYYLNSFRSHDISCDDSLRLDDARQRFLDMFHTKSQLSDIAIDSLESKTILLSRILAFWQVLWMSLLPLVFTGWWSASQVLAVPHDNLVTTVSTLALSLVWFFIASFCGLLIQAICVRPFVAFLNWCFRLPDVLI